MDLISIIVPVYNVEQYLNRCIESIINQSYENLEIILVDDGSTDSSGIICDKAAETDKRIKVIHKKNGGLSEARNYGIDIANGNYIGFVDSDDWIDTRMYEILYNKALKYNVDIVCCEYFEVNEERINFKVDARETVLDSEEALRWLLQSKIKDYAWNKLYRSRILDNIRYPIGKTFEDMGTTYKTFAAAEKIAIVSDILYYYFFRNESISNQKDIKKISRNKYDALMQYLERVDFISEKYPYLKELTIKKALIKAKDTLNFAAENGLKYDHGLVELSYEVINKYFPSAKFLLEKKQFASTRLAISNFSVFKAFINCKYKLKAKLPSAVKNKLYYYFEKRVPIEYLKSRFLKIKREKGKYLFLIGTPDHNNLGDHAIAYATQKFLMTEMPEYTVMEITECEFRRYKYAIKRIIRSDDIILIQGGGNWGNGYNYIKKIHDDILKIYRKNKIIILPQTIHYSKDQYGKKALVQDQKRLKKCLNVSFAARERASYDILKNFLPCQEKFIIPDMVLSLDKIDTQMDRRGALICLRNDKEGILTTKEKIFIHKYFRERMIDITITDTCISEYINKEKRKEILLDKWGQISAHRIVITDRLHGMIFSAITSTPCIVIGNYNHKIKSAYELLKNLEYIKFAERIEEIPYITNTLLELKNISYSCPFRDEYKKLFNIK